MLRFAVLVMLLVPQAAIAGDLSPIFGSQGTPPLQLALDATRQPVTAVAIAPAPDARPVAIIHVPAGSATAAR